MEKKLKSIIPKLPARDLDKTRDFYVNKLGFTLHNQYPDYLLLYRDDVELHFFLHCELNELENDGMCYIRVENVDGLYEELRQNFPTLKKPELKPWRQKEFYLNDIDHNNLAFGEHIPPVNQR